MNDQSAKQYIQEQASAGQTIKAGLSLHSYVSQFSGETVYQVCDSIGLVFDTIFTSRLERFFVAA